VQQKQHSHGCSSFQPKRCVLSNWQNWRRFKSHAVSCRWIGRQFHSRSPATENEQLLRFIWVLRIEEVAVMHIWRCIRMLLGHTIQQCITVVQAWLNRTRGWSRCIEWTFSLTWKSSRYGSGLYNFATLLFTIVWHSWVLHFAFPYKCPVDWSIKRQIEKDRKYIRMMEQTKVWNLFVICTVCNCCMQIMTRLAPLVGTDVTERCLLPRYAIMCSDALFHVRKVSWHSQVFLCKHGPGGWNSVSPSVCLSVSTLACNKTKGPST